MKLIVRQALVVLALAVAASPVMAKDDKKIDKKSKLKSGLFSNSDSKKKSSLKPKKSSSSSSRRTTNGPSSSGKDQFRNTTVNINKASAAALSAMVKGLGPAKAEAVVEYRRKNGKFKSLKDLLNVPGIGDETLKDMRKNISLTRGETKPPKGYKMGKSSGKLAKSVSRSSSSDSSSSSRSTSSSSRSSSTRTVANGSRRSISSNSTEDKPKKLKKVKLKKKPKKKAKKKKKEKAKK